MIARIRYDRGYVENWKAFFTFPLEGRPSYITGNWKEFHARKPTTDV